MPSENGLVRTTPAQPANNRSKAERSRIDELSRRLRSSMTPINEKISWSSMLPIAEEDLRQYIHDPVAALPPSACEILPRIGIVLVPYLERGAARSSAVVVNEKPAEAKLLFSAHVGGDDFAALFFTVKGEEVSDYHYYFYDEIAALLSQRWPQKVQEVYHGLLREELSGEVHGEVDEKSWHLKQTLLRRPMAARKDGKPFRDYARQSFEDTMTLYLHGICCDIDVETGPRQLPSRHLRKRLEALKALFPPPEGRAVFPEDLGHHHHH
ncbi:MAG TPA: hypothetical protein VG273_05340 [Bryobacteraceae bacterium]|nr:hypothetical protein [Bryobacteraceae bacterium]